MLRNSLVATLVLGGVTLLGGCNQDEPAESFFDEDIPAFEPVTEAVPAEVVPAVAEQPGIDVGHQFTLIKTVQQTLMQSTIDGSSNNQTDLELWMTVSVEAVRQNSRQYRVRYDRVRYSHTLPGERIKYDSADPAAAATPGFERYRHLVDGSFTFWAGPDNVVSQVLDPDGLFAGMTGPLAAPTDFVIDRVGFLPLDYHSIGKDSRTSNWTRQRRIAEPVPLEINTRYTLERADDKTVELNVHGTIVAAPQSTSIELVSGSGRLTVRGGVCLGRLKIDRATGFPIEAKLDRHLDMKLRLSDGTTFAQQKHELIVIRQPGVFAPDSDGSRFLAEPVPGGPATSSSLVPPR